MAHIKEIEEQGGMAKAIAAGIPKLRIEEAAARTQARIDSGRQTITGINKYQIKGDREINFLKVDNTSVREAATCETRRACAASATRPTSQAALNALTEGAKGNANLLDLAVKAARKMATVGEISYALEKVFTPAQGRNSRHHRRLQEGSGDEPER